MAAMRPRIKNENGRSGKNTLPRFLAVDFFCGAGGTTCGLIGAGGYVVAGIDKNPDVATTFRRNNRNRHLDRSLPSFLNFDVFERTLDYPAGQSAELFEQLDELLAEASSQAPDVPLLFSICAPCQPFTSLSKKEMTLDRRKKRSRDMALLSRAVEFVRVYEPQYVLSENVAGISEERCGGVWQQFQEDLRNLGYLVGAEVVDAVNFCVPQYRKRSILVAVRMKNRLDPTRVRLKIPLAHPRNRLRTVRETIEAFPRLGPGQAHPDIPNHRTRSLSELNQLRLRVSTPGASNRCLEDTKYGDLSLPCHQRVNAKHKQRCFNDVYTRMHPDRPSPTITTKCHSVSNGRFGHYDKRQHRGISLREAAALQTFPDAYVFHPTDKIGVVAQMIGNAVPPRLARFFADYLVSGKAVQSATVEAL